MQTYQPPDRSEVRSILRLISVTLIVFGLANLGRMMVQEYRKHNELDRSIQRFAVQQDQSTTNQDAIQIQGGYATNIWLYGNTVYDTGGAVYYSPPQTNSPRLTVPEPLQPNPANP